MEILNFLLVVITALLMVVGFLGTIFPSMPGLPLLWSVVVIYALVTDFQKININFLIFTTSLVVLVFFLDFIASIRGTRKLEASFWGVGGALAGGVVGAGFNSLPVLVILPVVGAVIGELISGRDAIYKIETEEYHLVGFVGGTIVKVAVGVTLIGLFLYKVL
ncbi:MAG: DUF456 domain-containing protein [Patescibacteria group bacterium]|nr:DUF456 domain-containing protein [Patescibacteria group bacterium]MDD5567063.1 DUF456 domain-containing protein [Patescibacteria group bacterium]